MSNPSTTLEQPKEAAKTKDRRINKRIFSGIQSSGVPHIGNYLGAMLHWVREQEIYETNIFCVVDLHAITVPQDPKELYQNTRNMAALLLAVGLDPDRVSLFVQSHVTAHAELAWLLDCVTSLGWLNRMHQFKSKAGEDRENASAGLYTYPVLMAADILLYDTDLVPVGDDQRQHIELTRDVTLRFNERYGEIFVLPEALIREQGARIMALDDPTAKMSKSHPEGAISLLDTASAIKKKYARAVTDSERTVEFNTERKGLYNLLTIYNLVSGKSEAETTDHFSGKGYKELKAELTELTVAALTPIQERYKELMGDIPQLEAILKNGADRVRPRAEATLKRAKAAMGIG
jgi:tryptophanyl-tRNA synthetase